MTHSCIISFMLAILGFAAFIAIMDLLFKFIVWLSVDKSDGIVLKFKDFEKYYHLNPSRYCLSDNWVVTSRTTHIYFSFLHNLQYKIWKRNLAKKKADRAMNLRLEEYLKTVQSDIEDKRKEAAAEIDRADDIYLTRKVLEDVLAKQQCFSLKDLAVGGQDVLAAGVQQGPGVGRILKEVLDRVIDGELDNERILLLGAIVHIKEEFRL